MQRVIYTYTRMCAYMLHTRVCIFIYIKQVAGPCEHGNKPSGSIKCWEMSLLAEELLASHDISDWECPQE
jgi:hypothetical protein